MYADIAIFHRNMGMVTQDNERPSSEDNKKIKTMRSLTGLVTLRMRC